MMRRAGLLALTLCTLAPAASWAQTTPEQAATLQQQIQDWLATTLGPDIKIAKQPIHVTADGDHYAIAVPLGDTPDAAVITATARQTGDRWAVDNIHSPSPFEFHMKPLGKLADQVPTGPMTSYMTVGQQAGQMLIDPTFATASTSNSTMQNLDIKTTANGLEQHTHLDRTASSMILQPTTEGRMNVVVDADADNYTIENTMDGPPGPFSVTMGHTKLSGSVDNVSRARFIEILHFVAKARAAMQDGTADRPALEQAGGAALLQAVADLASGGNLVETVDDFAVTVAGMQGSLHQFRTGFGVQSAGGLLQANLDIGAEGLTLPELGLGPLVDFIPTKVSLRPTVSGVPTDAVMAVASKVEQKEDPTPEDIQALFGHGGIIAGLDNLSVDVAGSSFAGTGKMVFTSPSAFTGTGQVTATNFDLLQQKIAGEPSLAQAMPVVIFLKGIGRSVQNQLVWDIVYKNGHVLVNNQDLTALAAAGSGHPPPHAPSPSQQMQPPAPHQPPMAPLIRPVRPRQPQ